MKPAGSRPCQQQTIRDIADVRTWRVSFIRREAPLESPCRALEGNDVVVAGGDNRPCDYGAVSQRVAASLVGVGSPALAAGVNVDRNQRVPRRREVHGILIGGGGTPPIAG